MPESTSARSPACRSLAAGRSARCAWSRADCLRRAPSTRWSAGSASQGRQVPAEPADDLIRAPGHLSPPEALDVPPTGGAQHGVPLLVGFTVEPGAVAGHAVELDEQPGIRIGEVHPADPAVTASSVEL